MFSDDHAAHAISAYGSKINTTPNIDRLAREGMLFRNAFCGNAICGPSRATVLTGKHSHANGFMRNGNKFDGDQTTFPKLLQKAGYQTALIGKWHLNSDPQGFDTWQILPGQGAYYNPDFLTPEGKTRVEGHCTELTTEFALRWLREERDADRPFLLMCQHKAPHRAWRAAQRELALYRDADIPEPATLFDDAAGLGQAALEQEMTVARHLFSFYDLKLQPTAAERPTLQGPDRWIDDIRGRMNPAQLKAWDEAYAEENAAFRANNPQGDDLVRWKYQRYIKDYLRCVAGVDRSVGELMAAIDSDPELAANTIFVYSSDQGFYLGDRGWYDKRWMYDESMRMPLIVRWPGTIPGGTECEALVQNIDFGPTLLDVAGVEVPADVHGRPLTPMLASGETPADWRTGLYYHYYESRATHRVAAHYGVRTDRYKLVRYYEPEHGYDELFDLQKDPGETQSVANDPAYAVIHSEMLQRLAELRAQFGDTTGPAVSAGG